MNALCRSLLFTFALVAMGSSITLQAVSAEAGAPKARSATDLVLDLVELETRVRTTEREFSSYSNAKRRSSVSELMRLSGQIDIGVQIQRVVVGDIERPSSNAEVAVDLKKIDAHLAALRDRIRALTGFIRIDEGAGPAGRTET